MSVTLETTTPGVPLSLPAHFSLAEQSFFLKKRHPPFSLSMSNSSDSSPVHLSHSLPPLAPSKGLPSVSRMFLKPQSPWTPLSDSLRKPVRPNSVYDPKKSQSYFSQCFTNLGLLGCGSFGEVYKVKSNENGRLYAVKRSACRFRGNNERNRCVQEARNHECLCPHPHILNFFAAWEEFGRLYIQTELCSTSLLQFAENLPLGSNEAAAWDYLCDLLSALQHLHSHGFVHLDLKPANILITDSGRLKLCDFGLLLQLGRSDAVPEGGKVMEDAQEGDPRYMAPELLRGEYGPAADIFSLGVSILEIACNIEIPNGGEGWQQLRQGRLPPEVTDGLSAELQRILHMMLAPKPSDRPSVSELLAFPSIRRHRWKRRIYLLFTESLLTLTSICQLVLCFGCKLLSSLHLSFLPQWNKPLPSTPSRDSWDRDLTLSLSAINADSGSPERDAVFLMDPANPEPSPTYSDRVRSRLWSVESTSTPLQASQANGHHSPVHRSLHSDFRDQAQNRSSMDSSPVCETLTPNASPCCADLDFVHRSGKSTPSRPSSNKSTRWPHFNLDEIDGVVPLGNFEPKNLLSLFEDSVHEEKL
ncbi:membrane-associated tyrosine- and threonine-specific cdc2-inhibitory kinase [Cynoglossus semilaevis]|uniref:non-specific serine/threonine protein kinase n=1 Tax=Cynoglossus semilaevis TaxID=244447 RepID=A0A3P8VJW5_CYNSE|nr:membrane-associated tyrosine- and threonine-specific cdc2-inhibitory kinase [Cynoglossus semilaevis]